LTSYIHQDFADLLCDEYGQLLQQPIPISSWLFPGAVVRHAAFGSRTKFEVTPEEALVLVFAPVACWYFLLPTDQNNAYYRYVLVIPEIYDLAAYAEFSWQFRDSSYENFWCASFWDGGLKFLSLQEKYNSTTTAYARRCQIYLFGKADWSPQQIVRLGTEILEVTVETISCYQLSCASFPRNAVLGKDEKFYIAVSRIRGKIADNLARKLPWWINLFQNDDFKNLSGELRFVKEALLNMIDKTHWDNEAQKLFIKACHEALRRIYAKLYGRASEEEYVQIEHRNIRIRSEVRRCKNAIMFREFLSGFFSEAGQVPTLQNHWEELLPIITGEVDWKLTRDLLLLALASYKKKTTSENKKGPENKDSKVLESNQEIIAPVD